MKIIKQSAQILIPESPMKHIEKIGRICYKSEDKISDSTDKKFVKMLFDNDHHAMLEHYRFIMQINPIIYNWLLKIMPKHVRFSHHNNRHIISFNARALMELCENGGQFNCLKNVTRGVINELITHIIKEYGCYELFGWNRDKQLPLVSTGVEFIENNRNAMSEEEWNTHGWFSTHIITDRGISHEIVRHREETSFAQESTRYCNYSQDRFDKEITIIDQGFDTNDEKKIVFNGEYPKYNAMDIWNTCVQNLEMGYFGLIELGIKPQIARSILPTCLKTEIVMTAPIYEWEHFFDLRMRGTTGIPHPMIKEIATIIYNNMMEVFYNESSNKN